MSSQTHLEYEMHVLYLGSQNFDQVETLLGQTKLASPLAQVDRQPTAEELSQYDVIISEFADLAPPASPSPPCIVLVKDLNPQKCLQLINSGYHCALEPDALHYLPQALISAYLQKKYRTESMQAERIMLLSERRYRRLFESAHDPILVLNGRNQRIVDANPEILQLLGLERRETIGRQLPDLIDLDLSVWSSLTKPGEPCRDQHIGLTITNKNNTTLIVDINVSKFDEGGHAILQVSLKDQTLQHEQQQRIKQQLLELTASEERFRVLSNQSPTPTLVVDISTGRIDYANLRAYSLINGKKNLADAIGSPRSEEILQTISECGVLIDYPLPLPVHGNFLINGELSRFQEAAVAHLVFAEN
jgi:PAS domain S-box-containing protein